MFAGYGRKIYIFKVSPDVSLGWLSLVYFAVEMREHVEVHRMAMRHGFSSIAWNSWGFSEWPDRTRRPLPDQSTNMSFILMRLKAIMVNNLEKAGLLID